MSARKAESKAARILRPLLIGLGVALAVCAVILILLSLVMTTGVLPKTADTPIAISAMTVAAFVGGLCAARCSRERGLLYGMGCGLLLFAGVTLIGLTTSTEPNGMRLFLKAVLSIVGGALGGVLGVNRR